MLFKLRARLLTLEQKHGTRELAPAHITRLIRQAADDNRLQFRTCRSYSIDPDQIIVGGSFDPGSEDEPAAIEIEITYHKEIDTLRLAEVDWDRISFEIAECIGHERVHSTQGKRKRAYKAAQNDEQEYLGSECEVQAYGYSIAAELAVFYALNFDLRDQVFMYRHYCDVFSHDQSVIIELDKHILKYLKQLEGDQHVKTRNPSASRRNYRRRSRN